MRFLLALALLCASTLSQASPFNQPVASTLLGTQSQGLLEPTQAFSLQAAIREGDDVQLRLDVAPGYYAYREKLKVLDDQGNPVERVIIPEGALKEDPSFGTVHTLTGQVAVTLSDFDGKQVKVLFQGCAEVGVCYPAMSQVLEFAPGQKQSATESIQPSATSSELNGSVFWFFLAGLGLAFTPCVLPTLPLLLRVVSGHNQSKGKSVLLASCFVLASAAGYAAIGTVVSALGLGQSFQSQMQNPWVVTVAAGVFVLLGLMMLDISSLRLRMPSSDKVMVLYHSLTGGSYRGALALGFISTLVLSPCVSAPLAGILLYLAQGGSPLQGGLSLFMLGVGMGLPLMVLAAGGHSLLPKSGPWLAHLKKVYAALMIGTGILVASRLLSGAMLMGLMGIIGVIIAGVLYYPVRHHRRFGVLKLLSTLAVAYALSAGIGATQGHTDLLRPWTAPVTAPYDVVADISSLQNKLLSAAQRQRPVVIEISADWCLNCKVLESKLAGSEEARLMAAGATWIKLDITQPNEAIAAWLKEKGLFGPPAFLFFDGQGGEVIRSRLIGEIELSEIDRALVSLLTP